ncbi:vWA domain-containing protein [Pseudoalteromonas rubra]|nr:vWA domain-containing protein [Pseudoalteromonas rubra]
MKAQDFDENGIAGPVVRRDLHFFWLVDISGSMAGTKIQSVNYAIKNVLPKVEDLQREERVNVKMRVITFGKGAHWFVGPDPVPIEEFQWVDIDANEHATATAQAIELLSSELTLEKMGGRNVPPVAVLLSDGYSTDPESQYDFSIDALNKSPWGGKAVRLSIGISNDSSSYNKEQLDQFVSPYLKQAEPPMETLNAKTAESLVNYIKVLTESAIRAVSKPDSKLTSEEAQADAAIKPAEVPLPYEEDFESINDDEIDWSTPL